jgi:broad specificity phosphatase PhoE
MADAGRRKVIYYVRHGQSTTNAALDAAMKANGKLPGDSPFHRSSRDVMCEQTAPPVRACRAAKFTHRR